MGIVDKDYPWHGDRVMIGHSNFSWGFFPASTKWEKYHNGIRFNNLFLIWAAVNDIVTLWLDRKGAKLEYHLNGDF